MTADFKHFSAFRSAADEAEGKPKAQARWENEGGSVKASAGRIVQTRDSEQPYKAVLKHQDGSTTEHPCSTMREGEAMIRHNTPAPDRRSNSRAREPGRD